MDIRDIVAVAGNIPIIKVGSSVDHTEVEADGTVVSHGKATTYDDQQVDLSAATLHPSATPQWVGFKGGLALEFANNSSHEIYFITQLSPRRKVDSDIDFHVHMVQNDTLTGNVRWIFTHSWASLNEVFPTETVVETLASADGVLDKHMYKDVADSMSGVGKGISSVLICSLTRDGTHVDDTYAGDILLVGADFHLELDTLGSREEVAK